MSDAYPYPRVGTGVYIRRNGKILFGFRTWKHAPGTWSAPGGKLELYESWEGNAKRETHEECGLEIENVRLMAVTNDVYEDAGQHYVTLHLVADWKAGEPELREPEKFAEWRWFGRDELPEPLLQSARNFVDTGYNPSTV